MIETVLFFVFGLIAILSVLFMVITKNVIHGAYALAALLLAVAGLYVLLNADFLAVVQIFMYAGGVVVLLIFGIMITNRAGNGPPMTSQGNLFLGSLVSVGLLSFMSLLIWNHSPVWISARMPENEVKTVGMLFLTDHLLAFELIAILLLAVLVGAALLAKKSNEDG